uniref:Uncharacterized protein n=1 Tax=Candidatus Kentrum sp. DK TaxID=2126562 RepID=A0A450SGF6_9GAMM|nr:MAG: hypothetical protein BECKDK2373B_GA0170837_103026 [Candidatus Kentron sp. DK]VFJ52110.1 MAG: hypothetical protein BECKDK2373C_GA0170839_10354 [Candidatus Kentron sp. DK]
MPYSSFTLKRVRDELDLELAERAGLFSNVEPRAISDHLRETLAENVSLAVAINTEKARSEFIIAPVLIEIRRMLDRTISLFSGIELNVDRERDLMGFCDFLISQSPEQFYLKTPVISIVEAKNENIMNGLGQCAAEMFASRLYNEQEKAPVDKVYGVVSSGNLWKFLKLEKNILSIDLDDYAIKEITRIAGILFSMVRQQA